jgi:hypothetical protein
MTPEQAIKYMIINLSARWDGAQVSPDMTGEEVDSAYSALVDSGSHWDAKSEIRASGYETDLPCDDSRNYESKSVAAKAPNGKWVGWTYWYGGGKHGEPDAMPWMENAYFVHCAEEEKVVTVRTFSVAE